MKHLLRIPLALVALTSMAMAVDLDIADAGGNDLEGTKRLFRFAEDLGFNVSRRNSESEYFGLSQGGMKVLVGVKCSESNIDRVVAKVTFTGKKQYVNNPELEKLVAKLNRSYNTCSFSLDGDGDISFKFVLPFDNRLSPRLFRLWCEHIADCTSAIIAKETELKEWF
jgi:hypothetical protein